MGQERELSTIRSIRYTSAVNPPFYLVRLFLLLFYDYDTCYFIHTDPHNQQQPLRLAG